MRSVEPISTQERDASPSDEGVGIAHMKPDAGSLVGLAGRVNLFDADANALLARAYRQAYAQAYAEDRMTATRHVKLFRNGRNQAVRIPVEFELPGEDALIRRDGDRLVIEPLPRRGLSALLATMTPLGEDFPNIADPAPAPKHIF